MFCLASLKGVEQGRGEKYVGKVGVLVGSTTRVKGKEVSKYTNDRGTNKVCEQSVGRMEGSRGVRK
jgi:hypothetical protein